MSSITTQIHTLSAEVKERFRQMMDKIHEEAGTSSTGRVRLKTQLDKEEKDRQALERQVISLRNETKKSLDKAANDRKNLRATVDLVEAERARLEARVNLLEKEVKSLRQFTGMPDLFKPSTITPKKYKNNPVQDRSLDGKK
jgi:predicted  nucleic acid-binding Zn-ribbon protein